MAPADRIGRSSAITQLDEISGARELAWAKTRTGRHIIPQESGAKHIFIAGVTYAEDDVETVTEETEGNDRIFRRLSYIVFFILGPSHFRSSPEYPHT